MHRHQNLYHQVLIAVRSLATDTASLQARLKEAYVSGFMGVPVEDFPESVRPDVAELHAAFSTGQGPETSLLVIDICARVMPGPDAEQLIVCIVNILDKMSRFGPSTETQAPLQKNV